MSWHFRHPSLIGIGIYKSFLLSFVALAFSFSLYLFSLSLLVLLVRGSASLSSCWWFCIISWVSFPPATSRRSECRRGSALSCSAMRRPQITIPAASTRTRHGATPDRVFQFVLSIIITGVIYRYCWIGRFAVLYILSHSTSETRANAH